MKEELRKAAAKYAYDYDGMQWEKDRVEIAFIKGADWFYSKLEAKDKEIADLKAKLEAAEAVVDIVTYIPLISVSSKPEDIKKLQLALIEYQKLKL